MTVTALVIEDEPLIAFELADILEGLGFAVLGTAATEDEAVAATLERRPRLLLVDVRLAVGDGVRAVERIAGVSDTRVVFVTANRDELLRRRPEAIGVDKPFTRGMIERAVRAVLAGPPGGSAPGGSPAGEPDTSHGSGDDGPDDAPTSARAWLPPRSPPSGVPAFPC